MTGSGKRKCPVCGEQIIGRADKIYCSVECRIFANNEKRKCARGGAGQEIIAAIGEDLAAMYNNGGKGYIKIISLVTRLCKIMHKFGG